MRLPKICCLWGSDAFQTDSWAQAGGLQLSCLLRGYLGDPEGASLADGVCLALAIDAASKVTEQEWREKAKKDLEEWNLRQNEQVEKNRANNRYVRVSVAVRAVMGAGAQQVLPFWDVQASFPTAGPSPAGTRLCQAWGEAPGLQAALVAVQNRPG